MARSVTIKINGKDVYSSFGLDILTVTPDILGMPELEGRGFEVVGRDGSNPSISAYKPRQLVIRAVMNQTTHANLLSGLKTLKQEIAGGHHGRYQFRIAFTDDSDIYYMARAKYMEAVPIGPRYIATSAEIMLTIIIEDSFGRYAQYALDEINGSPFSSPYSGFFLNNGSAIMRPRILLENVGAANLTDVTLINIACRNRIAEVISSGGTAPIRADGRWSDMDGGANFTTGGGHYLQFASQGLFNPDCFSFFAFFKINTSLSNLGYIFSTTGNTVRLYYDSGNTRITFDYNGNPIYISDASSGLVTGEWFAITVIALTSIIMMRTYKISDETEASVNDIISAYNGIPTNLFIGSDASQANQGDKILDDIRLYPRILSGIQSPSDNSEWSDLKSALGPLPIERQTALYLSFDYQATRGLGCENTELNLTSTVAQNKYLEIKCQEKEVYLLSDDFDSGSLASQMANVTGEFPFFIPGYNGFQVIHDGSASGVNLAIADQRRYL